MYKGVVAIALAIPRITAKFLEVDNVHKTPHTGIDFAIGQGTKLLSTEDGVIEKIVDYGSENIGKGVFIKLQDGVKVVYGHMSDIKVTEGQKVKAGDLIGLSGNTGHSTGPHLHLQAYDASGNIIDPIQYADGVFNNHRFIGGLTGKLMDKIDENIDKKISEAIDKFTDKLEKALTMFTVDLLDVVSLGILCYSFYQCIKMMMLNNKSTNGGATPLDRAILGYFIFFILRILTIMVRLRGGLIGK